MGSLLSSLRCICSALRSRWTKWSPRWRRASTPPSHHESHSDAEEGKSKADVPAPQRPLRDVKGGSKVHPPIVHVSIPTRPHDEPLCDAEEDSEAHGSTSERPLPDTKDHNTVLVPTPAPGPKKRALLVGISYESSTDPVWTPLEHPHDDVDRFRELLINTYRYSPDDIVVLKDIQDDPNYPDRLRPTRTNMIRELKRLVSGAAPGDMFTFLYSGHSDQQASVDDDEEDDQDEVIITCDMGRIIDNELNYILVQDLPVGCSLSAIFDTCHSGTMLDLPHYHCNDVYIPWLSKGNRRTRTFHNKNVRGQAFDLISLPNSPSRRPTSIVGVLSNWLSNSRSSSPLRIDTEVGGVVPSNGRRMSVEAVSRSNSTVVSPTRYDSPVSRIKCDGWCGLDLIPRATVVSLSACADLQRAWEGPRGSLTAVLCEFLAKHPSPSYRTLMTHVNYQLHANCRALHKYTMAEKKKAARGEGPGFDGELNNFQAPQLSSLSKLNLNEYFRL